MTAAIVVRLPERAFPTGWEQSPLVDSCPHEWESVYAEQSPGRFVEVDRCSSCQTPRCDRTDDRTTQCVERRHHSTVHIFESGSFDPVGGHLPALPACCERNAGGPSHDASTPGHPNHCSCDSCF